MRGVPDADPEPPRILPFMSSDGADNVKFGLVTVRRSVLWEPSGPRGLPVNCGHSDDFSRESKGLLAKWVLGEV